jgi:hypothetical protein
VRRSWSTSDDGAGSHSANVVRSLGSRTVGEGEVAGAELSHLKEFQRYPIVQVLEDVATLTEDDRTDHDAQLVEKPSLASSVVR